MADTPLPPPGAPLPEEPLSQEPRAESKTPAPSSRVGEREAEDDNISGTESMGAETGGLAGTSR
ncbi:MAG TPA: hypothetical protein VFQ57_05965 [Sphingomonas sp.]|nr:hypothetical protein [Sphingomonas sp.]